MDEQITLSDFGLPHEQERSTLRKILPLLENAATSMGASKEKIEIRHGKTYSSVKYGSVLAFRLRLRGANRYIEVPAVAKDIVSGIATLDQQKAIAGGFWRVNLQNESVSTHTAELVAVLKDAIDRLPKEWDCCSRYMDCSDAKHCIHPDKSFALGCGYRKILNSGTIYYGKNRNID